MFFFVAAAVLCINIFREVIGTEMRLKGEEAFFRSLQSSVHDLNEQLENSAKSQRELERMQQEVSNFHKDLVCDYLLIVSTTLSTLDVSLT